MQRYSSAESRLPARDSAGTGQGIWGIKLGGVYAVCFIHQRGHSL